MIAIVLALLLSQQGGAPAAQRPQGGLVTGRIQATDNSYLPAVRVAAHTVPEGNMRPEDGPNYFIPGPPASTALTDNEGRFRLENIPPGRYYIMGGLAADPTYFPSAGARNLSSANIVTVAAGQTIDNINFKLLGSAGQRLSGRLKFSDPLAPGQMATLLGSKVEEFLSIPVRPDGTFDFGRLPAGTYVVGAYPPPPGLLPALVTVRNADVTNFELTSPVTKTVSGRIVMQNGGPIPIGILGFYNIQSFVGAAVNPDGSFSVKLHAAQHRVDVSGLPVGYRMTSVKVGSTDAARGFSVSNADITNMAITISAPALQPRLQGTVTGLPAARLAEAKVELTGPIFGAVQASIKPDGSFDFPIMVSGLYKARLLQVPEFNPVEVVVTGQALTNVTLNVRAK